MVTIILNPTVSKSVISYKYNISQKKFPRKNFYLHSTISMLIKKENVSFLCLIYLIYSVRYVNIVIGNVFF